MIFNRLFKGFIILTMCVASVSLSSCNKKDVGGDPQGDPQGPDLNCKPGDDFYTYANADWFRSLEGADSQKVYGFFHDIDEATDAKLQAVKDLMPEYKALKQGIANRDANAEATEQLLEELVTGMFADVDTKEELYVAFGQAIRLGIPSIATLHTAICREDNTFGFFFSPPVPEMESVTGVHSAATTNLHEPSKRLSRYVSTRSDKTAIDYILEGIGLDPQYYLRDGMSDAIAEALEEEDFDVLKKDLAKAVAMELFCYSTDEYARSLSEGRANSVQEYVDMSIEKDLGYFTSYYFSQKYPTDSAEPAFSALGSDLIASFRKRLENNQWLSASTKQAAIEKLDYMGNAYGSPKKWPLTEMLNLEGKLLVADVLDIKEGHYKAIESMLGKSVKEYFPLHYMFYNPIEALYTYEVNAFYDPAINSFYVLPSFMLEPAYSANMDECKLYATWGVTIGHEMTHGFDQIGATYDKDGVQNNWWTASDAALFAELNALRAENVSTHEIMPGMMSNGEKTVTEDVADLGGFNIAYDLWVNKLEERGVTGDELIEQKKKFFINFAIMHSEKMPTAKMIERAENDIHSAGRVRVNSVVQQIDDWYELFGVTEGDALYLAPEKRITIW